MFNKNSINIELDSRIESTESLINAISNYFNSKNIKFKFISKSSSPIIEIANQKYYTIITSSVGAFFGVQKIKLIPLN